MPPLPPEIYVPIASFLIGLWSLSIGAIKILWNQHLRDIETRQSLEDKHFGESIKVVALNSEVLRGNTEALDRMADVVIDPPTEVKKRWQERIS